MQLLPSVTLLVQGESLSSSAWRPSPTSPPRHGTFERALGGLSNRRSQLVGDIANTQDGLYRSAAASRAEADLLASTCRAPHLASTSMGTPLRRSRLRGPKDP
jgi:hypothetical protein